MQNSIPDVKHHLKYGLLPEILFLKNVLVGNSEVDLSAVRARHFNFPYVVEHLLYHSLRFILKKNQTKIGVHRF